MGLTLALTIAGCQYDLERLQKKGASEEDVSNARDHLMALSGSVAGHVENVFSQISSLHTVMRNSLGLDSLDHEVAAMNSQLNAAAKKKS